MIRKLPGLLSLVVLALPLVGCKQGVMDRCQVQSDCKEGLMCVYPGPPAFAIGGTCCDPAIAGSCAAITMPDAATGGGSDASAGGDDGSATAPDIATATEADIATTPADIGGTPDKAPAGDGGTPDGALDARPGG